MVINNFINCTENGSLSLSFPLSVSLSISHSKKLNQKSKEILSSSFRSFIFFSIFFFVSLLGRCLFTRSQKPHLHIILLFFFSFLIFFDGATSCHCLSCKAFEHGFRVINFMFEFFNRKFQKSFFFISLSKNQYLSLSYLLSSLSRRITKKKKQKNIYVKWTEILNRKND